MWPPPILPINRTNATPQLDTHAADHNAVNGAVNDTVTKVTTIDALLAGTGTDGMGNVGKVLTGSILGVSVAQGAETEVAFINLTAGRWLVVYNATLVCSGANMTAQLKMFGTGTATRVHTWTVAMVGSVATVTASVQAYASAGRVSVNIGALSPSGTINTYNDPGNHQLFAVGVRA